jgi:thymidylate synthase (FAD)
MKIINQSYEILFPSARCGCGESGRGLPNAGFVREAKLIELAGRTAYKSEDKISDASYEAFIRSIIRRGHEAVIEFGTMMVKFITSRGITHELVRHRHCSFLQESSRYCNYSEDRFGNEITVIRPSAWSGWNDWERCVWEEAMLAAEMKYLMLVSKDSDREGLASQQARGVLPNDLKTEIHVRANFREWRHIFKLRCAKDAHPDIRALLIPLRDKCIGMLPCVFEDPREVSNE